ncbi:MAG: isochorismatase family protein [Rhizobiales bacterium]|nr:isochorismatase family protein [Hyphomicrobiales bacterium]
MKQSLVLDRKMAGLLLVDFQEEQRSDPLYKVAEFANVIANAQALLDSARRNGLGVFHAAYKRDFKRVPPRPFEPVAKDGAPSFSDVSNPATEICREVTPLPGEMVIIKNDARAFCEGDLLPALRQAQIDWLIVAGVWSEACVAASVRDAIASGFHVLLVKDACGSGTEAMHEVAILNLANRLYGGAVADTARACALMAGQAAEVWTPERPAPILFEYETARADYQAL